MAVHVPSVRPSIDPQGDSMRPRNSGCPEIGRCPFAIHRSLSSLEGLCRLPFARFGTLTAVLFAFLFLQPMKSDVQGKEIVVEPGAKLSAVFSSLVPGDEVILKEGYHRGGAELRAIHGTREQPIVIRSENPDRPAVIIGGQENLKFSSCSWIVVDGLLFTDSWDNGLHIDDVTRKGGVERSHHIVLKNLVIRDSGSSLNSDGMKISGCDDLLIENCSVIRWARDGSAIDLVRCRRVLVDRCVFDGKSWSLGGLSAKGGSSDITFRSCEIRGFLNRGIQIGGTTNLAFVWPQNANYEATRIEVKDCQIERGEASISVVNAEKVLIENCRLIQPTRWFFRLLSESEIPNVIQTQDVTARHNFFLMDRAMVTAIHIKPGIPHHAIQFSENIWYCPDAPQRTTRREVSHIEKNGIHGIDPVERVFQGKSIFKSFDEMEQIARDRTNQQMSTAVKGFAWLAAVATVLTGLWLATQRFASHRWREDTDRYLKLRLRCMPWLFCFTAALAYGFISFQNAGVRGLGFPFGLQQFSQSSWLPEQEQTGQWIGRSILFFVVSVVLGSYAMLGAIPSISAYARFFSVAISFALITQITDFCIGSLLDSNLLLLKEHVHAAAWGTFGAIVVVSILSVWISNRESPATYSPRGFSPLELPLVILVADMIYRRLQPLEFEGSMREIYLKMESLTIALVPDFRYLGSLSQIIMRSGPMMLAGILAAILVTSHKRPLRSSRSAAFWLLVFCFLLEAAQCILVNGYCSTANAIVDFAFGLIGIGLAHTLVAWHPWLSPRSDGSVSGQRMRWGTGLGLVLLACLAVARFQSL